VNYTSESWVGNLLYGRTPNTTIGCSYVQAITPSLTAGGECGYLVSLPCYLSRFLVIDCVCVCVSGLCQYDLAKNTATTAMAGMYDDGEHVVGAKYDSGVSGC
jgi:hypothetical protein